MKAIRADDSIGRRISIRGMPPCRSPLRSLPADRAPEMHHMDGRFASSRRSCPYGKARYLRSQCSDAPESDLARGISKVMEAVFVQ
jgi:hypothetical protein